MNSDTLQLSAPAQSVSVSTGFKFLSPEEHEYRRFCCTNCGHTFDVPIYCKNRFCPTCSYSRSIKTEARLLYLLSHLPNLPGYSVKMLTLTIRSQPDIDVMVKDIIKYFRRLRQRSFWSKYFMGGVYVLEVTGRPNSWHVHIHAVVLCRFIPYSLLLRHWKSVTSSTGVYISRIPKKSAVSYLTKYLTKCSFPLSLVPIISHSLQSIRMFSCFGLFHNLIKDYKKPPYHCPNCGCINWILLDAIDFMFKRYS